MICKYCSQEIDDGLDFCPFCGKAMVEEQPLVDENEKGRASSNEEVIEEVVVSVEEPVKNVWEEVVSEGVEQPVHTPKKSAAPLVFSIIAAVLALASLAVLLLIALGVDLKSFLPRANDIFNKESYCVEDAKAAKKGDVVIATMGGKELTNAHLQIYYRMQVMDFLNYYGSYADQLGLDLSLPLSEQTCYFEKDKTWEQYLLGVAIDTWQNYQIIGLLAEEAGYELDEEWLQSLEQMPADLLAQATEAGHASVDELLQDVIGPACTEELYLDYVRLAYLSNAYYNTISEQLAPTKDEVAAYFDENAAMYAENGITQDMGNIADVRHILVCPKNGTTDETTGLAVYSDEEWAICLGKAEDILAEWKSGEATEETFAQLATAYTEDTGSAASGGLYEGIAPGDAYVENFLNWTIDMNRQPGDTDIVKTEYGYHVMYYVAGEAYWESVVETELMSKRITEMTDAAEAKWPIKVRYNKITLSELEFE